MGRVKFIFGLMFLFVGVILAQTEEFSTISPKEIIFPCHSATNAGVDMYFHFDILDTSNDPEERLPVRGGAVYISTDGGASWSLFPATRINEPGYDSTYQAIYSRNPSSGEILYWYKLWTDSSLSLWVPENRSDAFPPANNAMAQICGDATGDEKAVTLPYGNGERRYSNTDLVDFFVGYSERKLYAKATVRSGGFPYSRTVRIDNPYCGRFTLRDSIDLQLYYLYVLPIINPYALYPDSVFYAAIYGDATISVLGLPVVHIWTGLYKIHKLDSTASWTDYLTVYTRLGDIDNTVSGNTLDLAVPWSLLTADADFGSFGMGQLIVTGFGIATLAVYEKNPGCWVAMPADSFVYAINDRSVSVGLYLKTGRYTISSSMPPRLSDYGASADTGGWQFYCTYTDPEGDLPVIREAVINGISYRLGSLDHVYSDGARFSTILGSVSGDGWYFFRFSDGANIVTTDTLRLALYVENLPYTKHLPIIVENPFPNPFNSSIVVPVVVYKEGIVSALEIYNLQGVLVDKIPLLFKDTGRQEIIWQPKNNLPSGIYLIRLKGENLFGIRKVVLIR